MASTNFEDLIMRDTRANQPAAGVPGRVYYVTDEGVTERDNGATWDDVSDTGGGVVGSVATITFVIDGGGSAIATGVKGDLVVDFACTIDAWTLLADTSGAIKIDIWRDTYANYPPTDADSLTNAHEPEIAASGVKAQDTSLGDWTSTAIVAGDVLRFNVDSITSVTRVTLALKVTRS